MAIRSKKYWIPEIPTDYKSLNEVRARAYRIVSSTNIEGENYSYCKIYDNDPKKVDTIGQVKRIHKNGIIWKSKRGSWILNKNGSLGRKL